MRRRKVMYDGREVLEIEVSKHEIRYDRPERDNDITLWNLVHDYVSDKWPGVKVDQWGSDRNIAVFDNFAVINKKKYYAADPEFFEYVDCACKKGYTICKGSGRRTLKTQWSVEAVEDLKAVHHMDVETFLIEDMIRSMKDPQK
jgi:hypothetical protein